MIFNETKEIERQKIIEYFKNDNNIYFNNIELFDDGIHLNYEGHERVANKVYEVIMKI